jgi:hypothetical protein
VAFPDESLLTQKFHFYMGFLPSHICFRKAKTADVETPQSFQIVV